MKFEEIRAGQTIKVTRRTVGDYKNTVSTTVQSWEGRVSSVNNDVVSINNIYAFDDDGKYEFELIEDAPLQEGWYTYDAYGGSRSAIYIDANGRASTVVKDDRIPAYDAKTLLGDTVFETLKRIVQP